MAGDCDAIYNQHIHVARTSLDCARELALQASCKVIIKLHTDGDEVSGRLEQTAQASRAISIAADGGYNGLCGTLA